MRRREPQSAGRRNALTAAPRPRRDEPDDASALHRNIAREGSSAHEWFRDVGFDVERGQVRVVADAMTAPRFRIARVWHSAGRMVSRGELVQPLLLLQLEGESSLEIDTTPHLLRVGWIAYVPAGARLAVTSDSSVARMEIEASPVALPPGVLDALERRPVLDASRAPLGSVLIAAVNSALNVGVEPHDVGFPAMRMALGNLVAGALAAVVGRPAQERTPRQRDIYDSALDVIAREAADPSFSVARLADEMNVSQPYLRTVFAAHQTTARAQLRAHRAALARDYLQAHADRPAFWATEAARLAGFRDADTMRAALRATEEHPDEAGSGSPLGAAAAPNSAVRSTR
ncbi:hypothetical protein SAMN06295885_3100 [Rathayibacter oskolensis]|uniref:HTH araC/xylS-type domain-containing protein n=1 Tax=Rathayibacter oskolensis TaxID=1891671 RepID=A0A1X7PDE6_9MICO|nr:helix-turn-helix domain-containing protein [Rathayibacter oskolensis]SMH48688.1 hypothetical protein SAMN06295885_3100 [Rathayibacter oskolensis]